MKIAASSILLVVAAASARPPRGDDLVPIITTNGKVIQDSYIVKFKSGVKQKDIETHHDWIQSLHDQTENSKLDLRKRAEKSFIGDAFKGLKHTYNIADSFLGYSGHFDSAVIERLRRHPDIDYIEQDSEVHTTVYKLLEGDNSNTTIQTRAPWGLARISHRDQLTLHTYDKYLYSSNGGEGVDVYVIDTGINVDHNDFEGRAYWGKTIITGEDDQDQNGHGTHSSGTIAGKRYGVAKKANIHAIKVLYGNGSGTVSDVVKGIEYVAGAHKAAMEAAKAGKKEGFKGSVANMGIGGGSSLIFDMALNAAVKAGVHFAVAAGNDNADACNCSPARASDPITAAGSTSFDERAYFSNSGKCVDIFAPGLNIQSSWIGSKYATNTLSGTSMASSHVAGLLAYLLSLYPAKESAYYVTEYSPSDLKKNLLSIGTRDALGDISAETPNILAWNGGGPGNLSDIIRQGGYMVDNEESSDS